MENLMEYRSGVFVGRKADVPPDCPYVLFGNFNRVSIAIFCGERNVSANMKLVILNKLPLFLFRFLRKLRRRNRVFCPLCGVFQGNWKNNTLDNREIEIDL